MLKSLHSMYGAIMPYLCVFSVAGCLVLFRRIRSFNKIACGLITVCGIILAWRLYIPLTSRRYATIVTLPAIFLGCYAVWHCEELVPFIKSKYIKYIKILLLIALPVGLLAKSWHFNPYGNSVQKLGAIIKNDSAKFSNVSYFGIDMPVKIDFYSGVARDDRLFYCRGKAADKFGALQDLRNLTDSNLVVYIAAKIEPQEEKPLENILRSLPGKTEKMGSLYINRKKQKRFIVYRYDASTAEKRLTCSNTSEETASARNVYRNPGFEDVVPLELKEKMAKRLAQNNQLFFQRNNLKIPKFVSIDNQPGYDKFSNAEVEAESMMPISGRYSLRIKSDRSIFVALVNDTIKGNYNFKVSIKSLKDSKVEFFIAKYNPFMTGMQRITSRTFPAGDTVWRYEIPISEMLLGACHHFWIVINLKYGEILLDDCRLEEVP